MLKCSREVFIQGKRGRIEGVMLDEARKEAASYSDVGPILNATYPHELALIAKHFRVPQRKIRIIDHPCGELAVFVTYQDGNEEFEGYLQELV